MQSNESIEWGNRQTRSGSPYRPLLISGVLFLVTFASDILLAVSAAQESPTLWFWLGAMSLCFALFFASLKFDYFKVLHYVVDHTGVALQYEVVTGPLEASRLVQGKQGWSGIRSAAYSTQAADEEAEVRNGVVLTLKQPLESGRTSIALYSDRPEQVMALVDAHLSQVQTPPRTIGSTLAIA